MYWVEVRPTVRRSGKIRLVPLEDIGNYSGFRSIVAYDDFTARHIQEDSSTAYLRGSSVYADTLFLDFDDHDPHEFRKYLQSTDLAFEEYHSGGRSVHFHIPIEPVFSGWVTAAMKEWCKINAPTADTSFFHQAGMYRLPGTYHYKYPGQCKRLLERREGKKLVLKAPESLAWSIPINTDKTVEDLFVVSTKKNFAGNRRPTLWLVATIALELGWDEEQVREHLLWVNNNFNIPAHDDTTVDQQLDQAIIRQSRRTA